MEAETEVAAKSGTRAKGTESLLYRVLQSPAYRTLALVSWCIDNAIVAGDKGDVNQRAQNILDRIGKYGAKAIPKNEFDLASWSDLKVVDGNAAKSIRKKTPRTFKVCPGCDRRFLARRANNLTCSDRCRARVARKDGVSQITEMTLPKAA